MKVLYVTISVVVLDQLTKLFIKGFSIPFINLNVPGMFHGQRVDVIGNFFQLTFVENPGMAFGVPLVPSMKMWVSIFSFVASVVLLLYLYKVRNENLSLRLSLALILGGAVGNMIDRVFYGLFYGYAPLFYGKVVDFFDFDFFDFTIFGKHYERWPIFNIADMAVSIGVLILILFYKKHRTETVTLEESVQSIPANPSIEAELSDDHADKEIGSGREIFKDGEDNNGEKISL